MLNSTNKYIILFLTLLSVVSCVDPKVVNINVQDWNKKIKSTIQEKNKYFVVSNEMNNELKYILNQRGKIINELNELITETENNDLIVVENYNCMFNEKNQTDVAIPFSQGNYYLNIHVYVKNKDFYYHCYHHSKEKVKFKKIYYYKNESFKDYFKIEEFKVESKKNYLLNDFIITSFLKQNKNEYEFKKINFRIN